MRRKKTTIILMDTSSVSGFIDTATSVITIILLLGVSGVITAGFAYVLVFVMRLRKRMQISLEMSTLEVQLTKDNEIKIDAAEQMFASFAGLKKSGIFSFLDIEDVLAFEILGRKGQIHFMFQLPTN